jgi:hypothetical protein
MPKAKNDNKHPMLLESLSCIRHYNLTGTLQTTIGAGVHKSPFYGEETEATPLVIK